MSGRSVVLPDDEGNRNRAVTVQEVEEVGTMHCVTIAGRSVSLLITWYLISKWA